MILYRSITEGFVTFLIPSAVDWVLSVPQCQESSSEDRERSWKGHLQPNQLTSPATAALKKTLEIWRSTNVCVVVVHDKKKLVDLFFLCVVFTLHGARSYGLPSVKASVCVAPNVATLPKRGWFISSFWPEVLKLFLTSLFFGTLWS